MSSSGFEAAAARAKGLQALLIRRAVSMRAPVPVTLLAYAIYSMQVDQDTQLKLYGLYKQVHCFNFMPPLLRRPITPLRRQQAIVQAATHRHFGTL
jgi:hypothetical protein